MAYLHLSQESDICKPFLTNWPPLCSLTLLQEHPKPARSVVMQLLSNAEKIVLDDMMDTYDDTPVEPVSIHGRLKPYMDENDCLTTADLPRHLIAEFKGVGDLLLQGIV